MKRDILKSNNFGYRNIFVLCLYILAFTVSETTASYASYRDSTYYSMVLKTNRNYRIFLPKNYNSSQAAYPVIYLFHGWGGRFNDWGNQANLNATFMDSLAVRDSVIMVTFDGRINLNDPWPYNIGSYDAVRYEAQYKDCFLELVSYIDSNYRTLTDRSHRATVGFSMGGIMSFFLAGQLPHLIGTAVDMMGSPEYYFGYPDNKVLYCQRYAFSGLHGVHLRFHNSTRDELNYLNSEVNAGARREKGLDYLYKVYVGGHRVDNPGETVVFEEVFNYVNSCFKVPLALPERWHHLNIYPNFNVREYNVTSNLNEPGFISIRGITKGGMGLRTRKWLPDGPLIPGFNMNITTAPLYQPNTEYSLFDYNVTANSSSYSTVLSDNEGKITLNINDKEHQIGIHKSNDPAELVYIGHKVGTGGEFIEQGKQDTIKLQILNRGAISSQGIVATVSTTTSGVEITNPDIVVGNIEAGTAKWSQTGCVIKASYNAPSNAAPFTVRINIVFKDNQNNQWEDEFDVPVFFDLNPFNSISIDDGKIVDGLILGEGNGDGIADPGETVVIYTGNHRTRAYYDDPYLDHSKEKIYTEHHPAIWEDGFTSVSKIYIKPDCPIGHKITLQSNYETLENNPIKRNVYWGTFNILVGGHEVVSENKIKLFQNYPNPFSTTTDISYQLPCEGTQFTVSLKIFDIQGTEVAVLYDGMKEGGQTNNVTFDASQFSSGMYFSRLTVNSTEGMSAVLAKKILLVK